MDRSTWIKSFTDKMMSMGVRAECELITSMAGELQPLHAEEDPVVFAQTEWDAWPPHDD